LIDEKKGQTYKPVLTTTYSSPKRPCPSTAAANAVSTPNLLPSPHQRSTSSLRSSKYPRLEPRQSPSSTTLKTTQRWTSFSGIDWFDFLHPAFSFCLIPATGLVGFAVPEFSFGSVFSLVWPYSSIHQQFSCGHHSNQRDLL
jgi:hypothetical protein